MNVPHINDLDGCPEIGRSYLVPAVCMKRHARSHPHWMPVLGDFHEDTEHIGFTDHHWHLDHRFLGEAEYEYLGQRHDDPRDVKNLMGYVIRESEALGPAVDLVFVCRQTNPIFPTHTHKGEVRFLRRLEAAYASATMKCRVCPHRGFPLKGQPVIDGVVVCPGHGLSWHVESGKLHPRVNTPHDRTR